MIFEKINNNNIVRNKINIQTNNMYVYSSRDTDGFLHKGRELFDLQENLLLSLNENSYIGKVPANKLKSKSIKYIDKNCLSDHPNINTGKLHMSANVSDFLLNNDMSITSVNLENDFTNEELESFSRNSLNYKVSNNLNNKLFFDIKRLKRNYLVRDINTEKINSVIRIQEYYNKSISKKSYKKINWSFGNYNTINFFTIGNISKKDSLQYENYNYNKTHKNLLIYPNIYSSGKQNYNFNDLKEFSFSFFINPNKKNIFNESNNKNLSYNAGCILFIPGLISIHIVKGSKTDINDKTSGFRLCTLLGKYSYEKIPYDEFIVSDDGYLILDDENKTKCIVSNDNSLSYNNWHNVVLSFNFLNDNIYNIDTFLDGEVLESHNCVIDFSKFIQDNNSFICLGNKPYMSTDNVSASMQNYLAKKFSINYNVPDDFNGPYSNKYINFGLESDYTIEEISDPLINDHVLFDDIYEQSSSLNNESFALNAEIHDIRIYNISLDREFSNNIFTKSVNEKFNYLKNLIFYIPVYYVPQTVNKKGLVNLHTDDNGNIEKQNITYNFPTNPYSFNFCGINDVSVESFLTEFVKNVNPNISINNNEDTNLCYNAFNYLNDDELKEYSQKGKDPSENVLNKLYYGDNEFNFYLDFVYRNNFILPNDNGIQYQNQNFVLKQFFPVNYENIIFETYKNYYDSSEVIVKNFSDSSFYDNDFLNTKFTLQKNSTLNSNSNSFRRYKNLNKSFINKTVNSKFNTIFSSLSDENRLNNFLDSYMPEDSFDTRKDMLWNISNKNFHSFYYVNDDNFLGGYNRLSRFESLSNYMIHTFYVNEDSELRIFDKIKENIRQDAVNIINTHSLDIETFNKIISKRIFNVRKKSLKVDPYRRSTKYSTYSNPCSRLYREPVLNNINENSSYLLTRKFLKDDNVNKHYIDYYSYNLPLYETDYCLLDYHTILFSISTQIFNKKIENNTLEILDVDLKGSGGSLFIKVKDNRHGEVYRANCLTKHASWNKVGNILYDEGFITINHPGISNFGSSNFKINFKSNTESFVHEINLPVNSGKFNVTRNSSYIEDLRLNESSFNLDEDFKYITDIHLHDENLNILAKARLARPFAKKNTDNVLFRLKMDY